MRSSLRNRLLALFLVLVVVVGAGTLYWIERTLADDLLSALDKQLSNQGKLEPSTIGRPIGEAIEISRARRGQLGYAVRELRPDEPKQYLVAVPADLGRVIRLAMPLSDIIETRTHMRNRLLFGFGFGFLGALLACTSVGRGACGVTYFTFKLFTRTGSVKTFLPTRGRGSVSSHFCWRCRRASSC